MRPESDGGVRCSAGFGLPRVLSSHLIPALEADLVSDIDVRPAVRAILYGALLGRWERRSLPTLFAHHLDRRPGLAGVLVGREALRPPPKLRPSPLTTSMES